MTNHWVDIKNANLVVVMGGNAAEAHPVGFRWAMEAKIHNGAKLIVIDPRFTRTASVADFYTPIRSGTDITFLSGVILYLLNNEKFNREYTEAYTNASLIVREDYPASTMVCSAATMPKNASMTKPAGTMNWMKTASPNAILRCSIHAASGTC